jgi:hypothetical protein
LIITHVYRTENLTATALARGGVAIIGIINRNPEFDGDDCDEWADLLYTIFKHKRPEFRPIPHDKFLHPLHNNCPNKISVTSFSKTHRLC